MDQATPAEIHIKKKYRGDARGNGRGDDLGKGFNSPRLHHLFELTSIRNVKLYKSL